MKIDDVSERVAVLDGSPLPWRVLASWFDSKSNSLILTLENPSRRPVRPMPEFVVLNGPGEGFFCFVRDPAGRRCRVTTIKPSETDARAAAERWLDEAMMEALPPRGPAYQWVSDTEFPKMHVCLRIGDPAPLLK